MTMPNEPPANTQERSQVGESASPSAPGVSPETPTAATPAAPQEQAAVPPAVQTPYPGYYPPYFAPVTKTPWVNPAKRTPLIISAVVALLVALGAGIGIGAAIAGGGHHGSRIVINGPRRGQFQVPGQGQRKFPLAPRNGTNGQSGPNLVPNAPAPSSGGSSPSSGS